MWHLLCIILLFDGGKKKNIRVTFFFYSKLRNCLFIINKFFCSCIYELKFETFDDVSSRDAECQFRCEAISYRICKTRGVKIF